MTTINFKLDHIFKIVLVGECGVGKSTLLLRYVKKTYLTTQMSTQGATFLSRRLTVENKIIHLDLWDTAGQERFRTTLRLYYKDADAIFFCFDVSNKRSFDVINNFVNDLNKYCPNTLPLKFLVATKTDLLDAREVSYVEGQQFAGALGMNYFEVSACTNDNIDFLFLSAAQYILRRKLLRIPVAIATSPIKEFKIVLIGDQNVGKSSLIVRLMRNSFSAEKSATHQGELHSKDIHIDGDLIKLNIWDTMGEERFVAITRQYYRNSDAIIVLYDSTTSSSFNHINFWLNEVDQVLDTDVVKFLVSTKNDLVEKIEVSKIRGQILAGTFGMTFIETSAQSGENVELLFSTIAQILIERALIRENNKTKNIGIKLQSNNKKEAIKTICCK